MTLDSGPGTELHKILFAFGFEMLAGCGCATRLYEMNIYGAAWCRARGVEYFVDGLEQEAIAREWHKLPGWNQESFRELAANAVREAIERSTADEI